MTKICFYFQVHQPYRIRNYSIFDKNMNYFDNNLNKEILKKVAKNCYLPVNKLFLKILKQNPDFKISLSLSGTFIEQLQEYDPRVLESFKKLIASDQVDLLAETYYHSLAFLFSVDEFKEQVKMHNELMNKLFHIKPIIFRNTELIYNNALANQVKKIGFKGIITQGADKILNNRSPNFVYEPQKSNIKLLLRNYKLSDDIAFRSADKNWPEHPLTAKKFAQWINKMQDSEIINLFMDYETFGEHQPATNGIFDFLEKLPKEILKNSDNSFKFLRDILKENKSKGKVNIPKFITWANIDCDIDTWLGNDMQKKAIQSLYSLEKDVKNTKNKKLIKIWRKLQTSDHFYYMSTRNGDLRTLYSPYGSPYNAFVHYMYILRDLKNRINNYK